MKIRATSDNKKNINSLHDGMSVLGKKAATFAAAMALLAVLADANAQAPQVKPKAEVTYQFNLPAQSLREALQAIGQLTSTNVLFDPGSVLHKTAPALRARLTTKEAIDQILQGTNLFAKQSSADTVLVQPLASKTGASEKPLTSAALEINADMLVALTGSENQADAAQPEESAGKTKKKDSGKYSAVEEMIVEEEKIKPFRDANTDLPRSINDPQPYYVFDSRQIERSGALNVQDFLRQRLTMDTTYETNTERVSTTGQLGTGMGLGLDFQGIHASTVSSFNLRGLGTAKTLILINGRRAAGVDYDRTGSSDMQTRQPDLNGLSLASIDRIEVLPSSGSAIYGDGAIGGVINIVLKRDFRGGELKLSHDTPSHSNAFTSTANATYGASFEGGKSRIMLSAQYSTSEPMELGERAQYVDSGLRYLSRAFLHNVQPGTTSFNATPELVLVGNLRASLGPTGTFVYWEGPNGLLANDGSVLLPNPSTGIRLGYIAPGTTSATPANQRFVPYGPELLGLTPGYGRFGTKQPLGPAADTKSLNASLTREMSSAVETFLDFQFSESKSSTLYVPSLFSYQSSDTRFPFFSSSHPRIHFVTTLATPVPVESGSMLSSVTGGFKAHFSNGWAGELSYTHSASKFDHNYELPDEIRVSTDVSQGLLDVIVDPFTVGLDVSRYNRPAPFGSRVRSETIAARMAGPVARLPWGDPTLLVGVERYKPSRPGGSSVAFWVFDGSPLAGYAPRVSSLSTHLARSTANHALFLEGRLPLITEKNALPLVRALDVQVAQRLSRSEAQTGTHSMTAFYNANGVITETRYYPTAVSLNGTTPVFRSASYNSTNGTFAFRYVPVSGVTLRASVGTAAIPPTYSQLVPDQQFTPALPNGSTITNDPLTGLTYRVNAITGGNPALKPQRSQSRDLGLIYEPSTGALKGLRANLQYYEIGQFDFIGTPSITELLTLPEFADRVIRDPVTRLVTQIDRSLTNIAEYSSAGLDATFSYDRSTSFGDWYCSLNATKIIYERRQAQASAPKVDYAGFPGSGGPVKYKANASLVWSRNHLSLGWNTFWYGSYGLSGSPGSPGGFATYSGAPWMIQGSYSVPSQMYHGLMVNYDFGTDVRKKVLSGFGVQLNIQNVFNTTPPFDVTREPFYLSPLGSYRLRSYALSVKKSF